MVQSNVKLDSLGIPETLRKLPPIGTGHTRWYALYGKTMGMFECRKAADSRGKFAMNAIFFCPWDFFLEDWPVDFEFSPPPAA